MVLLEEIDDDDEDHSDGAVSDSEPEEKMTRDDAIEPNLQALAKAILDPTKDDPSKLSGAIHQILTEILKPLFSRHPNLTLTGRKNLLPQQPQLPFHFDAHPKQPWKARWTTQLIYTILDKYTSISTNQKVAIEEHFHLLVPPILHFLDDPETPTKLHGCEYLTRLCRLLQINESDILRRTGLAEVFVDALRKTFTSLPSLTPEDESLMLMRGVYPAYMALVDARFSGLADLLDHHDSQGHKATPGTKRQWTTNQISSEITARTNMLTILYRHSLLYGLVHFSVGSQSGGTSSLRISTYLLSQISVVSERMGIYMAAHLQDLIPLLRNILLDPFVTADAGYLTEAVRAMYALTRCCWPCVQDRWYIECLAGLVGCWMNILDEIEGLKDEIRIQNLRGVQDEMRKITKLLRSLVEKQEFDRAKRDLLAEETSLLGLFDYPSGRA